MHNVITLPHTTSHMFNQTCSWLQLIHNNYLDLLRFSSELTLANHLITAISAYLAR